MPSVIKILCFAFFILMLNVIMLSVIMLSVNYAECHYAECRGADEMTQRLSSG